MLDEKFIKFLVVGVINTAFGYGMYVLLLFLGLHYAIASFFATVSGILFNFKTTGKLVFKNSDNALLFKFIGVYAVIYIINVVCLKVFSFFLVNLFAAGAFMVLPTAILSFTLNRKFVFIKGQK